MHVIVIFKRACITEFLYKIRLIIKEKIKKGLDMNKVYVTPHVNDWAVKQEGQDSIISVHNTKEEAIEAAKEIAIGREAELLNIKKRRNY